LKLKKKYIFMRITWYLWYGFKIRRY
jgi:hypothetical protein